MGMARGIDNIYLVAQCLHEKYGKNEFTTEDFNKMVRTGLGIIDPRTFERYYQYALEFEQIRQTESGKLVATPHKPVTHRLFLAKLRGEKS